MPTAVINIRKRSSSSVQDEANDIENKNNNAWTSIGIGAYRYNRVSKKRKLWIQLRKYLIENAAQLTLSHVQLTNTTDFRYLRDRGKHASSAWSKPTAAPRSKKKI